MVSKCGVGVVGCDGDGVLSLVGCVACGVG